jgi:hypothetical protein
LNAIAAETDSVFAGTADVVLRFARHAWMKICGACLATLLHGSVRTVEDKTVLGTNKIQRYFLSLNKKTPLILEAGGFFY